MDFSDAGDLIYITALDKNLPVEANSVILVYRAGLPAVAAFYDVYHLYRRFDEVLIDATGNFGDYVAVAVGSTLLWFRQYSIPFLVFEDSYADFDFDLAFSNDPHEKEKFLLSSNVQIANSPEKIKIMNEKLNDENFLSDQIKYEDKYEEYKFWDHDWFNGSVINYTLDTGSDENSGKIKVENHLEDARDFLASMDMDDYVFTVDGGFIQQFSSLIQMRHNGSIHQYATFPSHLAAELCRHVTHSWLFDFTVSACEHFGEVYLYVTTTTSEKPFTQGPYYSGATVVSNIETQGQMLMLVDVDENPSTMSKEGGVFLYSINHDPMDPEVFDEI